MKSRLCMLAALTGAVLFSPMVAAAQTIPTPPDDTSINQPPPAGPQASADACGNTPQAAFGQTNGAGAPTTLNDQNPKDITGAQQRQNMSSVTGLVVHTAGDLVLLQIPREAANGMDNPTAATPDKTMAVVRLPDGCLPALSDGTQLTAVGTPTPQGILNAEMVQTTQ